MTTFCQLPQSLRELYENAGDSVDWRSFETTDSATVNRFLHLIYSDTAVGFKGSVRYQQDDFDVFAEYHRTNIHLVDLNKDNWPEIIYEGYTSPGLNEKDLLIYLNWKSQFIPALQERGYAVDFQPQENGYNLIIMDSRCCTEFKVSYTRYSILLKEKTLTLSETDRYYLAPVDLENMDSYPQIPEKPRFVVRKKPVQLKSSPYRDDPEANYIEGEYTPFLGLYQPGSEGNIWNEYTDPEGRLWYFVAFEGTEKVEKSAFQEEIDRGGNQLIFGWILANENAFIR